jgi:hypothetical protein
MAFLIRDFIDRIGPSLPRQPSRGEVHAAIAALDINDIFNRRGTIVRDVRGWRIDIQNSSGEYINISVQRNSVGAPSTVASVMVPCLFRPDTSSDKVVTDARSKELSRAVKKALIASLDTYNSRNGKGEITRKEIVGRFSTEKDS